MAFSIELKEWVFSILHSSRKSHPSDRVHNIVWHHFNPW